MDSKLIFKFRNGDRVRTSSGRVGEIISCKYEIDLKNGESIRYYVRFSQYELRYMDEKEISEYHEDKFDNKFEIGLLNLLIDIYLTQRNFDMVKKMLIIKKQYEV